MKEFLIVVSLLISGVVSEGSGPYAPSGWRPAGPSFDLPERTPLDPRNKTPQKQEYLPPVEPKTPDQEYGTPEVDVSVQGLPTQEQLPIFQLSPINGQQYVGPTFNSDLKNLEQNLRDAQLQAQQNIYREFARQRQLEAALANANRGSYQPAPRQFVPRTTTTTAKPDDTRTTLQETTTEALNQGEVENEKKDKVTVEVSKQNIQEYPSELYLNALAQLRLQEQFNPVQLGQLRAPIFLEPTKQSAQYQAFTALLAQQQLRQLQQSQLIQSQQPIQAEPQLVQPQLQSVQPQLQSVQPQPQLVQPQPQFVQPQSQFVQPQLVQPQYAPLPVNQYQPANQYETIQPMQTLQSTQPNYNPLPNQYQPPTNQYETVQPVQTAQPAQPLFLQPQANQLLPRPQDQQTEEPQQPQQPQIVYYQPTNQYQPEYQQPQYQSQQPQYQSQQPQYQSQQPQYQYQQPLNSYQQALQPQLFVQDAYQQQLAQGQGSLQSGLDANQPRNGIDQDNNDESEDDSATATATATAFGARTQPRVYTTYGAPAPVPRVQAIPGYQTTTEAGQDEPATDGPAVAEATAVARGERRRPAKLRARPSRVRPIFTLDKSGHLVLAQE